MWWSNTCITSLAQGEQDAKRLAPTVGIEAMKKG
jgi:hypothetical protein